MFIKYLQNGRKWTGDSGNIKGSIYTISSLDLIKNKPSRNRYILKPYRNCKDGNEITMACEDLLPYIELGFIELLKEI